MLRLRLLIMIGAPLIDKDGGMNIMGTGDPEVELDVGPPKYDVVVFLTVAVAIGRC